jgi:hypothetical protein
MYAAMGARHLLGASARNLAKNTTPEFAPASLQDAAEPCTNTTAHQTLGAECTVDEPALTVRAESDAMLHAGRISVSLT